MTKRYISEYSACIPLFGCVISLLLHIFWLAAILYALWYLLYGFAGLAFFFSTFRKRWLSDLFLNMTFPLFLLPFRKSFYYWTKSINTLMKESTDIQKAYNWADKVCLDSLYTDNNKSMFHSYLAALHVDLGNKDLAYKHITMAKELPHKEIVDEMIDRICDILPTL